MHHTLGGQDLVLACHAVPSIETLQCIEGKGLLGSRVDYEPLLKWEDSARALRNSPVQKGLGVPDSWLRRVFGLQRDTAWAAVCADEAHFLELRLKQFRQVKWRKVVV